MVYLISNVTLCDLVLLKRDRTEESNFDICFSLINLNYPIFEKEGHLNREVEFLPNDEELNRRIATKTGLTRPELSVILA